MLAACDGVLIAEYEGIMALALIALAVVAYLYWTNFREKRERRRQERALEQRRRAKDVRTSQN
jgi:cbb3-type cytochrome oxidase subunit 3